VPTRKYSNRSNPKVTSISQLSDEELTKRLTKTLTVIVLIIVGLIASVTMFGPKIASLFGFISVHRNDVTVEPEALATPPIFSDVPQATKNDSVTINGITDSGSIVKLFVNGPEVANTTADNDGLFTFTNVMLIKGHNTVFAKSVGSSGKLSESSEILDVLYDDQSPEIKITNPKGGSIVRNLDKRILVTGTVNKKSTVKINDRLAITKPDLTFELLIGVEEGDVTIKIDATDEAGNTKTEKITVHYIKSS
jgi:bacillopeptidase F